MNALLQPKIMVTFSSREEEIVSDQGDTDMETSPVLVETAPIYPELKNSPVPDDRERIIQFCYELLCSERPLLEVLDEVKRLSNLGKGSRLDTTGEPGNAEHNGEARSRGDAQSASRTTQPPEPMPSNVVYHPREFLGALAANIGSDVAYGPDVLKVHQPPEIGRVEQAWGIRLWRLIGQAPLGLATAICLALLAATAGTAVVAYLPTAAKATSPVTTSPTAERAPAMTTSSESVVLRPNSRMPPEAHGPMVSGVGGRPRR